MRSLARVYIAATAALWLILLLVATLSVQMPTWRISHATERAPNYLADESTANLVFISGLTSIDDRAVAYFLIEPTNGVLIAPGTTYPLGPGEAVVSGNLLNSTDFISAQFGEVVGVVSDSVLLDSRDAVVYARPANGAEFINQADFDYGAEYANGFGPSSPFRNGSVVYDSWSDLLAGLIVISLLPPVGILTWVSRRLARKAISEKSRIFQLAGASYQQLWLLSVKEFGTALLIGAGLGIGFQLLFALVDITLPFVDFTTRSIALQPTLPVLVVSDFLLLITLAMYFGRPVLTMTPVSRTSAKKQPRYLFWLSIFACGLLITLAPIVFSKSFQSEPFLLLMFLGSGLLLVSFPLVLAFIAGALLSRLSTSVNFSPLDRMHLQWASRNAPEVCRAGSVTGIMLMLGVFISGFYIVSNESPWGDDYTLTKNRMAQVVVNCQLQPECFTELNQKLKSTAPEAFIGATFFTEDATGALQTYRVETGREYLNEEMTALVDAHVPESLPLGESPLAPDFTVFYVASASGLDLNALASIRLNSVPSYPMASWVGAENKAASDIYEHQTRWVLVFFTIATVLYIGAVVVAQALETKTLSRQVAGTLAMTSSTSYFLGSLAKQHLLITALSAFLSVVLGLHLAHSFVRVSPFELPLGFISTLTALLFTTEIGQFLYRARETRKAARNWSPGKGES